MIFGKRHALALALMASPLCQAEPRLIGSWIVELDAGPSQVIYAATPNDAGNAFGQYCFLNTRACLYLIGMKAACTKGQQYPVLLNSDKGAAHHQVYCDGQLPDGRYQYAFTDFKAIDTLARTARYIGFAIPLLQDQFQVIRFELRKSEEALDMMRETVDKILGSGRKKPPSEEMI